MGATPTERRTHMSEQLEKSLERRARIFNTQK